MIEYPPNKGDFFMMGLVSKKVIVREYLQRFSLFLYKVEEFYKCGKINYVEYSRLIKLGPLDDCTSINEELNSYVLSGSERSFLNANCTRNASGQIIDLQPDYVSYVNKLSKISEDVRRAYYLDEASIEEKRNVLELLIEEDFSKGKMSKEEFLRRINEINYLSEEELLLRIFKSYNINRNYYQWYLDLDRTVNSKNDQLLAEGFKNATSINEATKALEKEQKTYQKLINGADELQKRLEEFFYTVNAVDKSLLLVIYHSIREKRRRDKYEGKRTFFNRNKQEGDSSIKSLVADYNQNLYMVFRDLFDHCSLFKTAVSYDLNQEEVDSKNAYEQFIALSYNGDITNVSPEVYLNDLFAVALSYVADELERSKNLRKASENKINTFTGYIKDRSNDVCSNFKALKRISQAKMGNERMMLPFYSKEDEMVVYEDLSIMISNDINEKMQDKVTIKPHK